MPNGQGSWQIIVYTKSLTKTCKKWPPALGGGGGIFPYVWPLRWCAAGQGIVFYLSVLNKVYNSGQSVNRLLPGQLIWFVKFYLYSKYTKAMWLSNKMACILSFVLCPKQVNNIEHVVPNRLCILRIFCAKQSQGFKPSTKYWLGKQELLAQGTRFF